MLYCGVLISIIEPKLLLSWLYLLAYARTGEKHCLGFYDLWKSILITYTLWCLVTDWLWQVNFVEATTFRHVLLGKAVEFFSSIENEGFDCFKEATNIKNLPSSTQCQKICHESKCRRVFWRMTSKLLQRACMNLVQTSDHLANGTQIDNNVNDELQQNTLIMWVCIIAIIACVGLSNCILQIPKEQAYNLVSQMTAFDEDWH